jgi:uncharacterized caspase-like protein
MAAAGPQHRATLPSTSRPAQELPLRDGCRAIALVSCLTVLLAAFGCASRTPPPPMPDVYGTEPSERLSIDGLWKIEREESAVPEPDGTELWDGDDTPRTVQIERGRMYLQAGLAPGERHGTLIASEIHQSAAKRYRCRRPLRAGREIVWRSCKLSLEGEVLRVSTRGHRGELRLTPLLLADEIWYRQQAAAWHILSAREAHEPVRETPVIAAAVRVPSLPEAPAPTQPAVTVPDAPSRSARYRALVIGSADYTYLPGVATAEEDAAAVSRLLGERYGFDVTLLSNPTLSALLGSLDRYQRELGENDRFLLYWAGHGSVSAELGRCYWIPVEAMGDDPSEGLSNDDLVTTLRQMKAKQVLVVADSCFSAADRREAGLDSSGSADRRSRRRARVVLSSGGLEPVQDGKGGEHSVFTGAFLDALASNDDALDGSALFAAIRERVTGASQTPEYADIRDADHGGGDFRFVPVD